jgi:hypothetical protein
MLSAGAGRPLSVVVVGRGGHIPPAHGTPRTCKTHKAPGTGRTEGGTPGQDAIILGSQPQYTSPPPPPHPAPSQGDVVSARDGGGGVRYGQVQQNFKIMNYSYKKAQKWIKIY